jgi:hypothetical protein
MAPILKDLSICFIACRIQHLTFNIQRLEMGSMLPFINENAFAGLISAGVLNFSSLPRSHIS